ncbi:MAG: FecR domain-containing protein [Deltaproteobacteria bacterium]|nr:FecR domain-containing protein [Deltaproteobacteria bacterium]
MATATERATIDRLLAVGLPPRAEVKLRAHLRGCEPCRAFYDDEVRLLRAFAGDVRRPTPAELSRLVRRTLAEVAPGAPRPESKPSWVDAWIFEPWRQLTIGLVAASVAVLLVVFAGVQLESSGRVSGAPSLAAAVSTTREATVDGAVAMDGTGVFAGTEIAVGKSGAVELQLVRGGRVRLFPETRVVLGPRGETVELRSGRVWCDIDPGVGGFSVHTDNAVARVLGTSFVVEREASGATEVRVLSGAVQVQDSGHRGEVVVHGGQKSEVRAEAAPSPASHYDPSDDLSAWDRLWRSIGRFLRGIGRVFSK